MENNDNSLPEKKEKSLTEQARSGVIWTVIRALSSQGARFIASIVLARILFPEDFGIMGIALVVTRFAQKLGNFGFAQVLVQKKLIDEKHIRTTFTLNMLLSLMTAAIIFFSAPLIAEFATHKDDAKLIPLVIKVLQVLSITFILISFYAVPNSLLKRELKFKQESLIATSGSIVRYLSPIGFALFDYGVWSIVFGMLLGDSIQVVAFYSFTKWKPRVGIYREAVKNVFSFGIWLNLQSYVQYFYKNSAYFFVSKFLGLESLGYYERAYNLENSPRKRVSDMINSVLFATYSRIQDEEERLVNAMKKVMSAVSLLIFPAMSWLYFAAPGLIPLVYGEKWMMIIEPLQILAFSGMIESVTMIFYPAFLAKGLVKNRTKAHFFVLIILVISLFFAAQESIVLVSWAVVFTSFAGFFINAIEYIRNSSWTWKHTYVSLKPTIIITAIMVGLMYLARHITLFYVNEHSIILLAVVSIVAAATFFGTNYLFKFAEVKEIINLLLGKKPKKRA